MLVQSACVLRHSYQPVVWNAASAGPPGSGSPGYRRSGGDGENSRRRSSGSGSQRPGGGSSPKGAQFEGTRRRRGRGASQFSPDDTPLRDGNRDRLLGLLTERAAKTLLFYFTELNPTLMQWLQAYMRDNPIPRDGNWDDVSGETFLRQLLNSPVQSTKWSFYGREDMYACAAPLGVDPRNIAQRIMEIRSQIAKEWAEDLKQVSEENSLLMRETLASSFSLDNVSTATAMPPPQLDGTPHPDFFSEPDNSAIGDDD